MKRFFQKAFVKRTLHPVSVLIIFEIILFILNVTPDTYLMGWDNIMPELNLPVNLERSVTSVWQDYRGLGSLDGQAHAANLMHTVTVGLLSFVLPENLIRYTFIHLMHLVGGIGMFYLLKKILLSNFLRKKSHGNETRIEDRSRRDETGITIASLFGALFYMGNLGIIQLFYAPLEVFAVHFAALPVLTIQVLNSLAHPSRRNLLLLFLTTVLFTPQSFIPTVFASFLILLSSLLLFSVIQTKKLKPAFLVLLITILGNAFWLLPYSYSALHTPQTIRDAKINRLASEEIFYRNKAYGDILNVFTMKGFMLGTVEYDVNQAKDMYFMQPWITHTQTLLYRLSSLLVILIMALGIFRVIKGKQKIMYPFIMAFAAALFFLANNTPGLDQANTFFRLAFPLLGEAFRFPFTKFMTLFAFCFTIFFTIGIAYVLTKLADYRKQLIIFFTVFWLYLIFPVFQGYFTSPLLRLTMPSEYHAVFSYFSTQNPTARISLLPAHTFWNWQYRSWNYRGSDFLWYGLKQPILERAFDPWSQTNEQYYQEMSAAINRQDITQLNHIISKYDIQFILLDTSILNTLSRQPINFDSLEAFLLKAGLTKERTYGKLAIYRTGITSSAVSSLPEENVLTIPDTVLTGATIGLESEVGTYVSAKKTDAVTVSPLFPAVNSDKPQTKQQFRMTEKPYSFILESTGPFQSSTEPLRLTLPSLFASEFLVPVELKKTAEGILITPIYPDIKVNGYSIPVETDTYLLQPAEVVNPTEITMTDTGHVIPMMTESVRTYLLNPYLNTIKLRNGTQEELITLDSSVFSTRSTTVGMPEGNIDSVTLEFPKISSPFEHTDLIKKHRYATREVASYLPSVFGDKVTKITKSPEAVTLSAKSSNAELAFYLENLYHQASYLLLINAESKSGLPISFYADNPTQKRAEVETVLPKEKTESLILLPRTEDYFTGYGFHLTVKSVGQETATATISDIDLYPFPLETIQGMILKNNATENATDTQKTALKHTRLSLASYGVPNVPKNNLLMLSESYDPGWKLYELANNKWPMANSFLPFLTGKEIKMHTKVNNWSNGWIIPDHKPLAISDKQVVIVFLPQYLQYLGLMVTSISLITLIVLERRAGRRKAS